MEIGRIKERLNKELDQFTLRLREILPRYVELVRKKDISVEENEELGELEHYLIELNGKVAEIKNKLDQMLFGETIDIYYKTKAKASKGDQEAILKLDKLRNVLSQNVKDDTYFNWN